MASVFTVDRVKGKDHGVQGQVNSFEGFMVTGDISIKSEPVDSYTEIGMALFIGPNVCCETESTFCFLGLDTLLSSANYNNTQKTDLK